MRFIQRRKVGPRKPIPNSSTTTDFRKAAISRLGSSQNSSRMSFAPPSPRCAPVSLQNTNLNYNYMSQQTISTQGTKVLYTAQAHTTGGREGGASRTSDGRLDIQFTLPGSAGKGTNPEQLLSVGWSACFISALRSDTREMEVAFPAATAHDAA